MASRRKLRGTTPEALESELCAAAMDLAAQQIREGTASSQVITHFLKIGSQKERYELEKMRLEQELLKAKTDALASSKRSEELLDKAIRAMSTYSGEVEPDEEEGDY